MISSATPSPHCTSCFFSHSYYNVIINLFPFNESKFVDYVKSIKAKSREI